MLNLGLKPDLGAAVAELNHWSWHVAVPVLVDADGIPMCEAEQIGHAVGVKQIIGVDSPAHISRLLPYADTSDQSARIRP